MDIFVLYGQTATGKTGKALELVDQYDGEIINFDSRQLYKKLDIVTGKDRPSDPKYKIWLYDVVDPAKTFSSSDYCALAEQTLAEVISRGKTPILVGGTGYYLYHLLYGVPQVSVPENWTLRNSLSTKSVSELQDILKGKNPTILDAMNESDRQNPRRLIRRIEIETAGATLPTPPTEMTLISRLNSLKTHPGGVSGQMSLKFLPFFHTDSEKTRGIIRARVMKRLEEGAIEETQKLLDEGYSPTCPGLNAIGYQQIISYIKGESTREQMIELWITREIQYAKRQKTFFRKYFPV